MARDGPPSGPKDKIEVTIERRRVWMVNYRGQVEGRLIQGSATAPDLRIVGFILGGLQKATPGTLVKVRWLSPRPRKPKKGGR